MRGESHGPGGVLARRWHGAGGATLRRERRPRFPHHAAPHLPLLPLPRGGLDPAVSRAAADPSCAAATAHARESLSKSGTTGVGSRTVGGAVRGCGAAHPRGDPTARPTRGTQTGAAHVVRRLGDRRASADPRAAQAGTEAQARTATSRSRQPRRPSAFVCRCHIMAASWHGHAVAHGPVTGSATFSPVHSGGGHQRRSSAWPATAPTEAENHGGVAVDSSGEVPAGTSVASARRLGFSHTKACRSSVAGRTHMPGSVAAS